METGYSRHIKRKGFFGEIRYFLVYLWRYIKISIKNHEENEGYGIELQVLDEDSPKLLNNKKLFEVTKYYYDGPIWYIRFGFMVLRIHL